MMGASRPEGMSQEGKIFARNSASLIGSAWRDERIAITAAFVVVIALQTWLVFAKSINWDEFFHFHHITEFRAGTSDRVLQTAYLRPLFWLSHLPAGTIDQLLIGRLVMLGCELLVAAAVFAIARQFARRSAAAICALLYLTGGFVFIHGFALRADAPAAAMLMWAGWLILARRHSLLMVVLVGLLLGAALLVTIKSVFYAPVLLGLAWLRIERRGRSPEALRAIGAMGVVAVFAFALLFFWQGMGLGKPSIAAGRHSIESASGAVFSSGLLPQGRILFNQVLLAPHLVLILTRAPIAWWHCYPTMAERLAFVGLVAPLATLLFYRNSYPYYFTFILAPVLVAAGPVVEELLARWSARVFAGGLSLLALTLALLMPRTVLTNQRTVVDAVHEMFPNAVTYVDFCGMIGDFPRALPFLTSGWGLKNYRTAGVPQIERALVTQPVPLVIANSPVITSALIDRPFEESFLPADRAVLRNNYIHHWGPIWVAGKRIAAAREPVRIAIAVPGVYTVEGAALAVDGRVAAVGDVVSLARGTHMIQPNAQHPSTLRWGDHLPVPNAHAPEPIYFADY